MADKQDDRPVAKGYGAGYAIVGAGFQFAFAILFFLWIGHWADGRLGTEPLFTLVGLGIGLVAGFYVFWRKVMAESREPRR